MNRKKKYYKKKRQNYKRKNPVGKKVSNGVRLFRSNVQCYVSLFAPANTTQFEYKNAYPLNFPGHYVDNGGTYNLIVNNTIGPVQTTAIANIKSRIFNFFDMYKVQSLTVNWVPSGIWNDPSLTTINQYGFQSNLIYQKDYDDVAVPADNEAAMNQGIRPLSLVKPCTIKMYQLKDRRNEWYNCQNVDVTPGTTITGNTQSHPLSYGGIKIYCQDIPTSGAASAEIDFLGRFYLTWDVMFKGVNGNMTAL